MPQNIDELCILLGFPRNVFELLTADNRHVSPIVEVAPNKFTMNGPLIYFEHQIPKKGRSQKINKRIVWEVMKPYNYAYKAFARRFDLFLRVNIEGYPHERSFGYSKGKNILDNAYVHTGARFVYHIDIKDFFSSISEEVILEKFKSLGIQSNVAVALAKFSTLQSKLPQGFASSPVISNLICHDLDCELSRLSKEKGWQYSRYVDDLTLSSEKAFEDMSVMETLLDERGFSLNTRKTFVTQRGQSHFVTGLSVSETDRPRIPKKMKRRLRQELYYCNKFGVVDHLYQIGVPDKLMQNAINRLDGTVRYVGYIEKETFPTLRANWKRLLEDEKIGVGYPSQNKEGGKPAFAFVDESVFTWNKQRYMALGVSITTKPDEILFHIDKTKREFLANPFSDGDVKKIEKEGLHFVAATQDLRLKYINELQTLPVQSYIAFCKIGNDDEYEDRYMLLVEKLFPHRIMYHDKAVLSVHFEENSKISGAKLKKRLEEMRLKQMLRKGRYPTHLEVNVGSKDQVPHFAAPDFVLGAWGQYARVEKPKAGKPFPRDMLLFERLRDKVRVILNADNGVVFSRKRPFKTFDELKEEALL